MGPDFDSQKRERLWVLQQSMRAEHDRLFCGIDIEAIPDRVTRKVYELLLEPGKRSESFLTATEFEKFWDLKPGEILPPSVFGFNIKATEDPWDFDIHSSDAINAD